MRNSPSAPALEVRGLSKTFSGRTVVRNIDLTVERGEILGLVGQNGSGKSTVIKILAGYYEPDPGAMLALGGREVSLPLQPRRASSLGLSFVHQDLGLAPGLSVLENLRVGQYRTSVGWRIRWRSERAHVRRQLEQLGAAHLSPDALIESLPEVDRALVAIVRAIEHADASATGVLVLDEPTAYLPRDASDQLFQIMRRIAATGRGVIFVSHRLEEVREITDRVSVLRDGSLVDTTITRDLSEHGLLERILGRTLGRLYPVSNDDDDRTDVVVAAELRGTEQNRSFSVSLRAGEVLGLTGLIGMGHERLPYVLFGADKSLEGSIRIAGQTHSLRSFSPRQAISAGLALLPADRLSDSSGQTATVRENVTLPSLGTYFSKGFLHFRSERGRVGDLLAEFSVVPLQPEKVFAELSGGNQQKALVAKWFETAPKVLLLHEPTQGVDVGARKQIFQRIRDFADAGGAVLIASVEYDDLANLCNRVLVFRYGWPVSEVKKPNLTEQVLAAQCFRTDLSRTA